MSLKHLTILAAPVFFAFIIAYLFNPVVNYLEKNTPLTRGIVAGLLMVTLVFVVVILIINLFPYVVDQVENAAERFPKILEKFSGKVKVFSDYITKNFSEYVGEIDLMSKIEEMISGLLNDLSKVLVAAFSSIYNLLLTLLYLVFIPLFSYYFIKDYRKIQSVFFDLIPHRLKERAIIRIEKMDHILSSFIRGQAIVVLILAVLYSLGLSLIGLPFAVLIGVFAGVGDIIPYFGTVVGLILSLIVGFTHFQSVEQLLVIFLVFAIVKITENWYFYPKIVGREVGLHFVWVLMSIIIFGNFFGFWGLLVAIPAAAGFKMYIKALIGYYRSSGFFRKE
ncbi:MAG: AI-2E family transporter [bacterium]|nr:AI-2E family transporter [bacterium]